MGTRIRDKHKEWSKQPAYRKAYEALAPEFEVASVVIKARIRAGLSQAALAKKIGTKQPAIARIEGGQLPSTATLQRIAKATGSKLRISLEPAETEH
jgi:ribosome-binding protein aMBF1 (putative translation factor)